MLENVKDMRPEELLDEVAACRRDGMRFVTMTCLDAGEAFEVLYHFDKDYRLSNLRLMVPKGRTLPSISPVLFAAAFIENEIQDLFGLKVEGLVLDYEGRLLLAEGSPPAPLAKAPPAGGEEPPPGKQEDG